jgi:hypothetical protein
MRSPADAAMARSLPSIRRTSNIDILRGGGLLQLRGAARDLLTLADGPRTVAEATVVADLDARARLANLVVTPDRPATQSLIGIPVAGGFRDAVHQAVPHEVEAATPLGLLLDDLPVAALISGYALLYSGDLPQPASGVGLKSDICSGWRSDGTMMTSVRAGTGVPISIGPPAPVVADERLREPLAWHELTPLPPSSMRRRRLVEVRADEAGMWRIAAMFRDTHVDAAGVETVLHEYTLSASVDPATETVTACAAVPRVLPYVECPVAAASAGSLVGTRIDDVREVVRRQFRGTATCTHLNDLLRSLGDVTALATTLLAAV